MNFKIITYRFSRRERPPKPSSPFPDSKLYVGRPIRVKKVCLTLRPSQLLISTYSPCATLDERRKVICDICTTNPEQPMMVEEGQEWKDHMQSRKPRRMRRERRRPRLLQRSQEETVTPDHSGPED